MKDNQINSKYILAALPELKRRERVCKEAVGQQPEPVGWWCEDEGHGRFSHSSMDNCIIKNTLHSHEPLYTSTQVRKAFEELAEWLEQNSCRTSECPCDKVQLEGAFVNYTRRRMEEW